MAKSQIKVSSIMFTDIVDYSKMVQRDQALALELVEEHNQIIKGNIGKYPGKIIKFTGDGFMAEFDSSTSAVTAAITIQKDLSLRNETILVVAAPESEELFTFSGEFEVIELIVANSLGEIESRLMPTEFTLTSAYPNPFNPVTTIQFGLPVDSHVSMTVYDIQGRLVTTLSDEIKSAGYHSMIWNASQYSSGVYFVSIYAQNTDVSTVGSGSKQSFTKTQKVMLVK